jgi:murein DD-endopeptidase MepM/ murein hydrolase activator NlpD
MVRLLLRRPARGAPRYRLATSVAVLVVAMLLGLSSCAAFTEALLGSAGDDQESKGKVLGSSVFHAAADQPQMAAALTKVGPPWSHSVSLVEQLRPGAKAPRYEGKLPVNTLIAPATPTDVGSGGEYGWRRAPDLGIEELHNGADIAAAKGSNVVAAMEGVVRAVFWDVWGGNRVEVAHAADMVSTYNHLDTVLVDQGEKLQASQQLGTVGQTGSRVTGPHLHFETWVDGEAVDPQSFDWIVGDRIIPAPHANARNPQVIPRKGPGDKSSIDGSQVCPYQESDPKRCRPPDVPTPPDKGSTTPPVDGWTPPHDGSTPMPVWPELSSAECSSTAPGIFDCAPVAGTAPGAEDCPAAAVEGARTDCPAAPPELSDSQQCRPTEQGTIDCVPFASVPGAAAGPEDCPAAPIAGARTDCPPAATDLPSPSGNSSAPPAGGEVAPLPGTEATVLGRRKGRGPAADPGGQQLDPQWIPW